MYNKVVKKIFQTVYVYLSCYYIQLYCSWLTLIKLHSVKTPYVDDHCYRSTQI